MILSCFFSLHLPNFLKIVNGQDLVKKHKLYVCYHNLKFYFWMIHSLSLISISSYFISIKPPLDGIHGKVETKQSDGKKMYLHNDVFITSLYQG